MRFFRNDHISYQWRIAAFLIKVISGIFFIWLYSYHYSNRNEADVYKYFDDGKVLYEVSNKSVKDFIILTSGIGGNIESLTSKHLQESHFWDKSPSLPFFNDNRFIIRFNALMMLISGGNIYSHMIVAVFFSFLGLFYLFKFFNSIVDKPEKVIFLIVFLIPSLLFWTSSILKESFLILGFGGFLWHMQRYAQNGFKNVIFMLFFALIITQSKMYVLLFLMPPTIAYLWNFNKKDGKGWLRYLSINLIFIALALNIGLYFPEYNIMSMLAFKQSEFKCLADWTGAGSVVYIPDLTNDITSFFNSIPHALYNSILRPVPWDKMNMLSLIAMLEIMAIIGFILLSSIFKGSNKIKNLNFILFSINFIVIMALLIGWTTPLIGAIVRYRIVYLPFMVMIPLLIIDLEKIGKFVGLNK